MVQTPKILLIIRPLPQQGERILGNRWLPFVAFLRTELANQGTELELSSNRLLAFTFDQGLAVLVFFLRSLIKTKKEYGWQSSSGSCPLQIIADVAPSHQAFSEEMLPDQTTWESLHHEAIYISPALEEKWQAAVQQLNAFPRHQIQSDGSGLNRVTFPDYDNSTKPKLLAFRALPVSNIGPECFYCGMTSHSVTLCPSKYLSMSSWGLSDVGYLTYAQLNSSYKKIFPEKPELLSQLARGIDPLALRQNQDLLVFIAFLDISAICQPRFLWNFAFSGYSQWHAIFLSDRLKIDNRNLHLGLDCLRVGQHEQAHELLEKENKRKDGNRFAANIGLAFCSMERNRTNDTLRHLTETRNLASQTREIIYANLLLSRYYELQKDFWNAKEAVTNALKADYDCADIQYRRVQLAVREGLGEREFKQLRSLIVGQKEIFMKALLDPQLLPVQGLIEEILRQQHDTIAVDAKKNLISARQEATALEVWLPEDDKRRQEHRDDISFLDTKRAQKSYFDLLDVSERSNGLFSTCRRLRKEYTDRMEEELGHRSQRLSSYLNFWKGYEYKVLFKNFQNNLATAIQKNKKSRQMVQANSIEATRQAIILHKDLDQTCAELKKEYGRLLWVRTAFNGLKLFGKRLLICELIFVVLLALMVPILATLTTGKPSLAWLAELAANRDVQRNTLVIATLFIAPFISLAWTMLDLQNS